MAMQSPEIQLSSLNSALRRLRGASHVLGDEETEEKLLDVVRRLLLAEVLGNTWILAMGGSQGAGKTTLMSSLYGLREQTPNWLQSNEGRGEKMPVLIQEVAGLTQPQGYVRRLVRHEIQPGNETKAEFKLEDVKVELDAFQQAIFDPNAEDLLPVLQVPPRYFTRSNQAWLLLPGYEKQERSNRSWQELMRQAMLAAGGCVVVTDETRMANQQQMEIVRDMLENELEGVKPYIVISKAEIHRSNPKRLAELRASAQATFQVSPEHAESHIIFSGSDDPGYIEEWMPKLKEAIADLNRAGASNRAGQIGQLSGILGKDLTRVLNAIGSKATLFFRASRNEEGDGSEVLNEVLEAFDAAAAELREAHHAAVGRLAGKAYSTASKAMDERLINEREGFSNWLANAFDTHTEMKQKMQALVQASWHQSQSKLFIDYVDELKTLTLGRLGGLSDHTSESRHENLSLEQSRRIRLGYSHASGEPVQFKQLTTERANDIKILLADGNQFAESESVSKQLTRSIGLIPVVSLEYSRLFYALPEANVFLANNASSNPGLDVGLATESVESLKAGVELGKTALRSVAGLLAVDVLSDGDSDLLGTIFGQPQESSETTGAPIPAPMTLHPAAVAATAVVAAAFLTAKAVTGLRTREKEASTLAHGLLGAIHDQHVMHLKTQFDDTMAVARARVRDKVRARYRMDEALMHKDRLVKSIADVKSIAGDLQHELDSSAAGLQVFGYQRAS